MFVLDFTHAREHIVEESAELLIVACLKNQRKHLVELVEVRRDNFKLVAAIKSAHLCRTNIIAVLAVRISDLSPDLGFDLRVRQRCDARGFAAICLVGLIVAKDQLHHLHLCFIFEVLRLEEATKDLPFVRSA